MTPHPCGQCMPCRINRARVWCHRLLLEQSVSAFSCFATLTYAEPSPSELCPEDVRNFLKRLRYYLPGRVIRYYAVGEYGDNTFRPHYHLALFNVSMTDEETILKAWGKGFVQVGDLSPESARYIVGYITKRMTSGGDPRLGGRHPEFARMSTGKGGIGIGAVRKYAEAINKSKYKPSGVVRELRHGSRDLPLGRYLTEKLSDLTGTKGIRGVELREYQEELLVKHGESGIYKDNVLKEFEAERRKLELKHEFFAKRSKL